MNVIDDPDDTFLINYLLALKELEEKNNKNHKDEQLIFDNRKDIILSRSFFQLFRKYLKRIQKRLFSRITRKIEIE